MSDFVDKKERVADLIEDYIQDDSKEKELLSFIHDLSIDDDFKNKELFHSIFKELSSSLSELSRRELKQRILMIRSFIE